jgi:hypothetical protein
VLQQAVVALYFDEKGDEVLCEDLSYVGERTIVECVDPVAGGANPCPPRYTLVVINNSPRCVYTG